jgi:uncharacterized protein (DUF3084 family)
MPSPDLEALQKTLDEAADQVSALVEEFRNKEYRAPDGSYADPRATLFVLQELATDWMKVQMAQAARAHAFTSFMMAVDARRQEHMRKLDAAVEQRAMDAERRAVESVELEKRAEQRAVASAQLEEKADARTHEANMRERDAEARALAAKERETKAEKRAEDAAEREKRTEKRAEASDSRDQSIKVVTTWIAIATVISAIGTAVNAAHGCQGSAATAPTAMPSFQPPAVETSAPARASASTTPVTPSTPPASSAPVAAPGTAAPSAKRR